MYHQASVLRKVSRLYNPVLAEKTFSLLLVTECRFQCFRKSAGVDLSLDRIDLIAPVWLLESSALTLYNSDDTSHIR